MTGTTRLETVSYIISKKTYVAEYITKPFLYFDYNKKVSEFRAVSVFGTVTLYGSFL